MKEKQDIVYGVAKMRGTIHVLSSMILNKCRHCGLKEKADDPCRETKCALHPYGPALLYMDENVKAVVKENREDLERMKCDVGSE